MMLEFHVNVDPIWAYLTVLMVAGLAVTIYLMVHSADENPPSEIAKTADNFAGVIRDAHGPITKFLWAAYAGMVLWAIAYIVQHWQEFLELGY